MDHLYTPWRLDYVVNPKAVECPFCAYLAQDPSNDAANLLLHRAQHAFVMLNRYPYNNGHLMVLPNRHISNLAALDDAAQLQIMQLTSLCITLLTEAFAPQGFNVGVNMGKAAGAGLADHLHVHVVPRWFGDTNFMPIVAQTRVLPEWLEDTYRRLRAQLEILPGR